MFSNIFKVLVLSLLPLFNILGNNEEKKKILVGKIDNNIDPRTNRYSKLLLEEALDKDYDIVVIEMDTYGGAVNDADDIRTRILDFEIPIYVWINKDAASAGALISLSCDKIIMTDWATIGAATAVNAKGEKASEKVISYMREEMASTAEANGKSREIAEAMVDENIKIDSVIKYNKIFFDILFLPPFVITLRYTIKTKSYTLFCMYLHRRIITKLLKQTANISKKPL